MELTMATLHEAQDDYIKRWKKNAEQHFNDCDYDWVASLVAKAGAQRISDGVRGGDHAVSGTRSESIGFCTKF